MYILTGGAGFIGSAVLQSLNSQGIDNILVVDNLGTTSSATPEKWKNLQGKRFADYMHKERFFTLLENNRLNEDVSCVIHLGACSSTTERNAEYMMHNNYAFSRALAAWAIKRELRFIYASSAATYGDGEHGFSDADIVTPTLKPLNIYGYSKQLFDEWALRSGAAKKMVGLKFFNVYGPNEYHKGDMTSVIYKAFHQIRREGKVQLFRSHRPDFRDGEQQRDFIYVKDCSATICALVEHKKVNGIFNLGTGKARSWNELVSAVFAALGQAPQIEYIDLPLAIRDKYQYFTEATMTKLSAALPSLFLHPLEDGVRDYVQSYLLQNDKHL